MSAEIICVGTELLLGNILNINAQFLAQQLAILGIPHYYQTVVGDNPMRLKQVIEIAKERASLLISLAVSVRRLMTLQPLPLPNFLDFLW